MDFEIVVIGLSLGGRHALEVVLPALPKDFPLPVALVQHRGSGSDATLVAHLQKHSALPVAEPEDKEVIRRGQLYLAPADYHLLVEGGHFALSTEAPVWYARPSIDVLFESAAAAYGEAVIGVLLTGANQDGVQGLAAIKRSGGLAVVQDPKTAQVPEMAKAAIAAAAVDKILPLEEIGPFLADICCVKGTLPYGS